MAVSGGGEASIPAPAFAVRGSAPKDDDRALVLAAQAGSADAVEALIRRFWPDAHRIAIAVTGNVATGEDIAQEALLSVVDRLKDFDADRPFRPWLFRITTNRALDHARRQGRRPEVSMEAGREPARLDPAISFVDEGLDPLMALEPNARAALVLRFLVGLTSEEIGEALGLTAGSVRSLIHRSRARLINEEASS